MIRFPFWKHTQKLPDLWPRGTWEMQSRDIKQCFSCILGMKATRKNCNIGDVKNVKRLKAMSHTAALPCFVFDKPQCSKAKGHYLQPFKLCCVNISLTLKQSFLFLPLCLQTSGVKNQSLGDIWNETELWWTTKITNPWRTKWQWWKTRTCS